MRETVEFETPSWNQIHKMLINQSEKILADNYKPDIIIAITRGGWIPARVLSDLLEAHNLTTIGIEFYLDISKTRKKPILTQELSTPISGKKILLVDDVADTGESLQLAKKHILNKDKADLIISTLYKKPQSVIEPDYYEKTTKQWIIFPWEIKETAKKIWDKNEEFESKKPSLTEDLVKKFLNEFAEGNHL
jgi:hypoxanthine phosphoribosyltransferase